jgi:hypothetical protein
MSEKDYYAPGTYNDPNAPWNQEDIEDTDEFQNKKLEMWKDKISDGAGYMLESISERSSSDLNRLGKMIRDNVNGTYTVAIGALVSKWVWDYCEPADDDVIEELREEPYDPRA